MGLRDQLGDQLEWVKNEWGIFAQRDRMGAVEAARWLRQWVPFGARTMGYGAVSLAIGPLTPDHGASLWAMREWCRSSLTGLRMRAEVSGTEHVPAVGSYVYASNHQSLLDILVLGAVLPGDFKWAAKRSLMKIPFLGWHLQLAGHVPVDRDAGKRGAVETIHRFEAVLSRGKPLLIFPEGTRSQDGEIQPFKTGGFYAAVRAGRPVVPVALEGTHELMGKGAADSGETMHDRGRMHVRHIEVVIGAPIAPLAAGKERDRVEDLRVRTQDAVLDLHEQLRARRSGRGG